MENIIQKHRAFVAGQIEKSFDSNLQSPAQEVEKAYNVGDEKDFNGRTYYVHGIGKTGAPLWRLKEKKVGNKPSARKPGSTDEIERMDSTKVRQAILGLNNIAANVKDKGDYFHIEFDANDFNTNGQRSPQIDRIAKFLEGMGASCVYGQNSIKAYKKFVPEKKANGSFDKIKSMPKDTIISGGGYTFKKKGDNHWVELSKTKDGYKEIGVRNDKDALKLTEFNDFKSEEPINKRYPLNANAKSEKVFAKNTADAFVKYLNGDDDTMKFNDQYALLVKKIPDEKKRKEAVETAIKTALQEHLDPNSPDIDKYVKQFWDDLDVPAIEKRSKSSANKVDDTTIDQSVYDSAYKTATSKTETESHLKESLQKIDKNIKDVKDAMSSASSATFGKLQKTLTSSVSKKKAIEDALKNFKRTDPRDKVAQNAGFKDYAEMKDWQGYVTAKTLLKKPSMQASTKKAEREALEKQVSDYEKNHTDVIAAREKKKSV